MISSTVQHLFQNEHYIAEQLVNICTVQVRSSQSCPSNMSPGATAQLVTNYRKRTLQRSARLTLVRYICSQVLSLLKAFVCFVALI